MSDKNIYGAYVLSPFPVAVDYDNKFMIEVYTDLLKEIKKEKRKRLKNPDLKEVNQRMLER